MKTRRVPLLLIVVPRYVPLLGGMERQAQLLADAFVDRGWGVTVVTECLDSSPRHEVIDGVKVVRVGWRRDRPDPIGGPRSVGEVIWSSLSLITAVLRHGRNADLVIVRTFTVPSLVVGFLKRLRLVKGASLVTAETGGDEDDPGRLASHRLACILRYLVKGNDLFNALCTSNLSSFELLGIPADSITRIPNGIRVGEWMRAAPDGPNRRFVYFGRLEEAKGLLELVRAFHQALLEVPDLHLAVIGDGPLRDRLRLLSAELGLDEVIAFTPAVGQVELRQVLAEHDVFVLPSYSEAMPLSVIEAAAANRRLILTDVGDLRETFGEAAIIVPPRDVDALAEAIVLTARGEYPNFEAASLAVRFDVTSVASAYADLVRNER